MSFKCKLCGKAKHAGNSYSHSHTATKRTFKPNLHKHRLVLDGKTKTVLVCTSCIKSGFVIKPKA
ncbi:MAG: 50S ribosomal protein L28 [Elusimicrobia bacterium]|nr:50S ribosomal protein L28 [Elusimicrobiota bacterium]